jgi:uncharacterized membrane protein
MTTHIIQFLNLFVLMLVTGIFWGPWFSLHRSIKVFNPEEFIHIVQTLAANLAVPMRILMPLCILLMFLSGIIYPDKNSFGFYLNLTALGLSLIFLVITILVEVPIVTQIKQWTHDSFPSNWDTFRNRWLKFHVIRTFASLAAFACYSASIFLIH